MCQEHPNAFGSIDIQPSRWNDCKVTTFWHGSFYLLALLSTTLSHFRLRGGDGFFTVWIVLLQQSVKFDRMINCPDWLSSSYSHSDCFVFAFFLSPFPSCQPANCQLIINFVHPVKCGHKLFMETIIWLSMCAYKVDAYSSIRERCRLKQALAPHRSSLLTCYWANSICLNLNVLKISLQFYVAV